VDTTAAEITVTQAALTILVERLGTQAAVAERLGYSEPSVCRWRKGTGEPSLHAIERITRLLVDELAVKRTCGHEHPATAQGPDTP